MGFKFTTNGRKVLKTIEPDYMFKPGADSPETDYEGQFTRKKNTTLFTQ